MCPDPRDQCTGHAGHRVERRPSRQVAALHSSYQSVPGQVGCACYGASANFHELETFEYIAGVEVGSFYRYLKGLLRSVRLAAGKYAAFSQPGLIATIRGAVHNLWTKWIPELGLDVADAPDFESYGSEFDARTGMGGFEIWVPIIAILPLAKIRTEMALEGRTQEIMGIESVQR